MKGWRVATVLLILVLIGATSCNPFGNSESKTTEQSVKVVRGDLTVTVSGSGNIEVANELNLTFGVAGRIDKIYLQEGDEVSAGEVLARLETDALELAVTQAEVAVTQAEVAVTQAEVAVTQAKINLGNAGIALEKTQETYTVDDIKAAQSDIGVARRDLNEALWVWSKYEPGTTGYEYYQKVVAQAEARLKTAEDKLEAMLTGFDTDEVAIKKLQVESAGQSLELAEQSVAHTRQSLELTRQSLAQARRQLDKATLTAPFAGIVADVAVDEKDTITTTTTIIHLIDISRMELVVEVDEVDIVGVRRGQRAIIEVDAMPGLLFEGKVSYISYLPKEEAGVIVFEVKIEFDVAEGTDLRSGMSVDADIIIAERNNALLVPNRAISQDGQGNPIAEVIVGKQVTPRTVAIGISDGFQTEIVSGLEEGEVVIGK